MKTLLAALAPLFAACSALPAQTPVPVDDTEHAHQVSFLVGMRSLDEDDYEPVEDQTAVGLEYAYERPGGALGFELGVTTSSDDDEFMGFDVEADTFEIYGGVRKTFGRDVVRPVIGGGLALIESTVEVDGFDVDDDSIAAYVHGGVGFHLAESFVLGLDARLLVGSDLEIAGVDTDADYGQAAIFLGFTF